jgi:hypothetical protein
MLDHGWRIEPPVYVRPRWRSALRTRKEHALHFVLWNRDQVSLVSVLDCPEIQQFLVDRRLPIDHV